MTSTNGAQPQTFYHGSRFNFGVGFQLQPQPDGYTTIGETIDFERLVDARRPADKLSRFESVFLTRDPDLIDAAGGNIDAVYRVEPLSKPEASDLAWYTEAFNEHCTTPCNSNRLSELIDCYWSGKPFHTKSHSLTEYRVSAGTIIEMVELNAELDDLEVVTHLNLASSSRG
jgi:hypothetical protein